MAPRDSQKHRLVVELIAFLGVIAAGLALIALGVAPESLAVVTVALSGLYSAWRNGKQRPDRDG